jgi:hypothetical protein
MLAVAVSLCAAISVSACGGGGAASAGDPVSVVTEYMKAIASGNETGAQAYLQTDVNDGIPLKGPTPASRYFAEHKGAKWQVVAVKWKDLHTKADVTTKNACTVIAPQGGEMCLVTVEADPGGGGKKLWFHFDVENRYPPGKWVIVNVTEVDTKPDDLLPTGNEAFSA